MLVNSACSNKPTVLHICSDFPNKQIYKHLVKHLADKGVSQLVYSPVRSEAEAKSTIEEMSEVNIHLRDILRLHDRLLFRSKIRKIYRDLCSVIKLSTINFVHAHFLYSDGAVALKLKRQQGIPYIVAVRNTDINVFMRYRPDLRWLANDIIREASQVVFISPGYRAIFFSCISTEMRTLIANKSIVVPNGVGPNWLKTPPPPTRQSEKTLRVLYVGDFTKNKNVPGLLNALFILYQRRAVQLTLVGGGGDGMEKVQKMLALDKFRFAEFVGRITQIEHLQRIYQNHDLFAMPSFKETFGVVYIEALSQGLPIIHSNGQGVDGFFEPGTVSESVDPTDPLDIARKIEIVAARCHAIRPECINEAKRFDWKCIANTYESLYLSNLTCNIENKFRQR